mmetsp:Transcript_51058/g.143723  ORF Transcript_51058/g.143723 Transcript_51058/m.143723 type:complete len:407 (-) Transcript_51058:1-1221(-)
MPLHLPRDHGGDRRLEGVRARGDHAEGEDVDQGPDALGGVGHVEHLEEDEGRHEGLGPVALPRLAYVVRLQNHAADAEEQRQERDDAGADEEADAELLRVFRGVDPLPERQVEDLGTEDGEAERHEGVDAHVVPDGDLLPVVVREGGLREDDDHDDHDEQHDGHGLDPVRHEGGRQAADHGVDHREEGDGDDAPLGILAVEHDRHVAHGLQLADQVDEHVVDEHERHVRLRDPPEAPAHPVRDVPAVLQLVAELGREVAHHGGAEEHRDGVAEDPPPAAEDGGLPGRVQHPGAGRRRADAQRDARPALGVAGAVPEVRRGLAPLAAPFHRPHDVGHRQAADDREGDEEAERDAHAFSLLEVAPRHGARRRRHRRRGVARHDEKRWSLCRGSSRGGSPVCAAAWART